ncbi:hypothetical protein MCEMRE203_00056 [Candidatus Nanopelagicaceae bacterium]
MSSKTTFKRIALVAVAALGLGVLSVAPSSATINSDNLTVSATTASQTTSETATATSATATLAFLAGAQYDSMSVTASLVSGPATSVALPYLQLVETASAKIDTTTGVSAAVGSATAPNAKSVVVNVVAGAAQVSATYKVYLGVNETSAPTVAGTYVVKLTPAVVTGTLGGGNATAQTITITVAKSVVNTATTGTVILNRGETNSAVVDDVVTASKASTTTAGAAADAAATIKVSLLNALGTAAVESYTATISGPGTLAPVTTANVAVTQSSLGRAISIKHDDLVQVLADGTAGEATITISTASGVVIATKKVTFYGAAATITAKTAALTTGTIAKVGPTAGLISFDVKDAAGVAVTTGSYYLVSNDTTKISNSYTSCGTWDATNGWTCSVTGVAKGTGTVYVTNKPSATDTTVTTVIKSGDVSVRVGSGVVASVAVTTDKTAYAPGEKISLKVTLKDSDGNAVVSGDDYQNVFATGGIVASYALGSASDTTTATSVLKAVDGVKTYTLYAPNTQATVKFTWTTGTGYSVSANAGVDGSLSVTVADQALEAANAATTAALAANDAVDALAATVAKLVANLKSQITALTKLIVKIQKKVGA